MNKCPTAVAGNRDNNEEFNFYEAVPIHDEDEYNRPKKRKNNSKKFKNFENRAVGGLDKPSPLQPQRATELRRREPGCLENSRCYFCEFCDNTSIHGFKFLGERRRYLVEKLWWMLVVCLALFGSGMLIQKAYNHWMKAPVIVTFATTETPIWKIPFPAVTICPEVNASPSIFNYTDVYLKYSEDKDITEEEEEYFNLFSLVCNARLDFLDINETKIITEEDVTKFLEAFVDVEAEYCMWQGAEMDCNSSLSYTITSEGWCRTFNMLDLNEVYFEPDDFFDNRTLGNTKARKWSLEEGYPQSDDLDTYPRRTMLAGTNGGFQIDFFVDNDDLDYICGDLQGFKVTLHHPAEEPNMENYFRVPLDQVVVAGIKPKMITTADEVRAYRPEDRQCYLPGEKALNTYKIYTQNNCMFECLANYTVKKCRCIPFHMPGEYNSTPICGAGSKPCTEKAKVKFLQEDIESQINHVKGRISEHCGCLPACTSIEFNSETSQTDWNWRRTYYIRDHDPNFNYTLDNDHFSRLIVYYQDMQFMTSERHELYGTVDFLATCGGLLGLFCGFSFTSLIEIVYYLTLRLCCNFKKFGWRVWSGDSELVYAEEERRRQNDLE